jgi:hypothetical protein
MFFIIFFSMFRICSKCDFEWHHKDGNECPVCGRVKEKGGKLCLNLKSTGKPMGGIFFNVQKTWVQALAIISVVCLLVLWLSSG